MAINKVIYGNDTLVDLTEDTVTPATLLQGQTAHDRSGNLISGSFLPIAGVTSFNGRSGSVLPMAGDYDIDDMGDVVFNNLQNGQILKYNSSTQKWVNDDESGGGESYLEQVVTLIDSSTTTVTFTDPGITTDSLIDFYCSKWYIVPDNIALSAGTCVVTMPLTGDTGAVIVRIYVKPYATSVLEQTVTTSTSATTNVTFTDPNITTDSLIEYYCSKWALIPDNIVCSAGTCVVTLPKESESSTVTVRIYIK